MSVSSMLRNIFSKPYGKVSAAQAAALADSRPIRLVRSGRITAGCLLCHCADQSAADGRLQITAREGPRSRGGVITVSFLGGGAAAIFTRR